MEDIMIFDSLLINYKDFAILTIRFLINIFFASILIRGIYYPINRNREYLFTYFIFNVLIFFVASLLSSVKLKTGFAFGLFAVFSILRYRTRQIQIKEMTFLFIVIIMATINSTVTEKISYVEILFANIVIVILSFTLERIWLKNYKISRMITYEKIELIKPERHKELIEDLETRLGKKIAKIEIGRINFLRDTARILVFFSNEVEEEETEEEKKTNNKIEL